MILGFPWSRFMPLLPRAYGTPFTGGFERLFVFNYFTLSKVKAGPPQDPVGAFIEFAKFDKAFADVDVGFGLFWSNGIAA